MLKILLSALFLVSAPAGAAPFQSARTIDGAAFDPAGQVTIVNYCATWCAPCRVEMPVLDAYYRKHHAQGLAMLAISIDAGAPASRLRALFHGLSFPVARIDDVRIARRDIPTAVPVTRVYDRAGRMVFQTKGDGRTMIDAATLERVVTPLLSRR